MSEWRPIDPDHLAPAHTDVLLCYGNEPYRVSVARWERVGQATGWHLGESTFAFRPRFWMPIPDFPSAKLAEDKNGS